MENNIKFINGNQKIESENGENLIKNKEIITGNTTELNTNNVDLSSKNDLLKNGDHNFKNLTDSDSDDESEKLFNFKKTVINNSNLKNIQNNNKEISKSLKINNFNTLETNIELFNDKCKDISNTLDTQSVDLNKEQKIDGINKKSNNNKELLHVNKEHTKNPIKEESITEIKNQPNNLTKEEKIDEIKEKNNDLNKDIKFTNENFIKISNLSSKDYNEIKNVKINVDKNLKEDKEGEIFINDLSQSLPLFDKNVNIVVKNINNKQYNILDKINTSDNNIVISNSNINQPNVIQNNNSNIDNNYKINNVDSCCSKNYNPIDNIQKTASTIEITNKFNNIDEIISCDLINNFTESKSFNVKQGENNDLKSDSNKEKLSGIKNIECSKYSDSMSLVNTLKPNVEIAENNNKILKCEIVYSDLQNDVLINSIGKLTDNSNGDFSKDDGIKTNEGKTNLSPIEDFDNTKMSDSLKDFKTVTIKSCTRKNNDIINPDGTINELEKVKLLANDVDCTKNSDTITIKSDEENKSLGNKIDIKNHNDCSNNVEEDKKINEIINKVNTLNKTSNPTVIFHTQNITPLKLKLNSLPVQSHPLDNNQSDEENDDDDIDKNIKIYKNEIIDLPQSPILNKSINEICFKKCKNIKNKQETEMNFIKTNKVNDVKNKIDDTDQLFTTNKTKNIKNPLENFTNNISAENYLKKYDIDNQKARDYLNKSVESSTNDDIKKHETGTNINDVHNNGASDLNLESSKDLCSDLVKQNISNSLIINSKSSTSHVGTSTSDTNLEYNNIFSNKVSNIFQINTKSNNIVITQSNKNNLINKTELDLLNERSHRYLNTIGNEYISDEINEIKNKIYVDDDQEDDSSLYESVVINNCSGVKLYKNKKISTNNESSLESSEIENFVKEKKKKLLLVSDIFSGNLLDENSDLDDFSMLSDDEINLLTPDDEIENSILEQIKLSDDSNDDDSSKETTKQEYKICNINGIERKIDFKVIEPYKRVLSHGGYINIDYHNAIIVFSACYLPHHSRSDYNYVMDNLFFYILYTLDEQISEHYVLVYLHGATNKNNIPKFSWLKKYYQLINRKLKKNLKQLYIVHSTFWLKTIILMSKPFVSSKFSKKIKFVTSLNELYDLLPIQYESIPDKVKQYDKIKLSMTSSSAQ